MVEHRSKKHRDSCRREPRGGSESNLSRAIRTGKSSGQGGRRGLVHHPRSVLIGDNNGGPGFCKTTLLYAMGSLEKPGSGSLVVGDDIGSLSDQRSYGLSFDERLIHLSGFQPDSHLFVGRERHAANGVHWGVEGRRAVAR